MDAVKLKTYNQIKTQCKISALQKMTKTNTSDLNDSFVNSNQISSNIYSTIKAENNIITFEGNSYYNYISKDGKSHYMVTTDNYLGCANYDNTSDDVSYRTAWFWRMMSGDGSYVSLQFSHEEQIQYLESAGIEDGFFSVTIGNKTGEHYYSSSSSDGVVIRPKWAYDQQYSAMTSSGLFFDYEPGDIFKVDGEEYVLSENYTLKDIPYGADLYNVEYPDHDKGISNHQVPTS